VPAKRRRPVAVIVRCAERGHQLLSIAPATGAGRFLVVRAPGRAGGSSRDTDQWLRTGVGTEEMSFETLPALTREVHATDAGTVSGLLGDSPYVFCRCGRCELDEATADRIGEALYTWHQSSKGITRPVTVTATIK
jgi:hypothetical protein